MVVSNIAVPTADVEVTELTPTKRKGHRKGNLFKKGTHPKDQFVRQPIYANLTTASTFGVVPIGKIVVDHTYQRQVDTKRVSVMAHNWDQDKAGVVVVNHRPDGMFSMIDGQQRYSALLLLENTPNHLFAQIFEGLSKEDEAQLFYELDTKRSGLTQSALFKALVASKNHSALEIVAAATAAGLTADPELGHAKNNLRAYGTLLSIHRRIGKDGLTRVLRVASSSWPDNTYWGAGSILLGLEAFFVKYPVVNEAHLINALSHHTPHIIENRARTLNSAMSSALGRWVARVVLSLYNSGMKKNRLPDWE